MGCFHRIHYDHHLNFSSRLRPSKSAVPSTTSESASPSSSFSSTSSPTPDQSPGAFLSDHWYFSQTVDFDAELSIFATTGNTTVNSIWLLPADNLGISNDQFWQLRPAPNTFSQVPHNFLHNRAFGPSLSLALSEGDMQSDVYTLQFSPANVETRNQYLYFESRPNANYSVVYNRESGMNFPLTMAADWGSPMMAGGEKDSRKGQ